ncbi:transposase [Phaeodactylibacter xiamenensis]|uniref:transposase n=1 Tax=Phaeodactylibacter xiamenensis TaxID=1524460 RepID=UPI00136299A6|nr:transposase [Phaeodactylibacter xiamenensis]
MYVKLTKKFITHNLMPYLSTTNLGRKPKVKLWKMVKAIIYRLKTGTQWRELPLRQFFGFAIKSYKTVFYHYNKWAKDGSWHRLWTALLKANKAALDMSTVALDGSQTRARMGGEAVGYQSRKSAKTTNMLFLTDSNGIPLAMSKPVSGNHHDLYEINKAFKNICEILEQADIDPRGLVMNADAGFDSRSFREYCDGLEILANIDINKRNAKNTDYEYLVDPELYKQRFPLWHLRP